MAAEEVKLLPLSNPGYECKRLMPLTIVQDPVYHLTLDVTSILLELSQDRLIFIRSFHGAEYDLRSK